MIKIGMCDDNFETIKSVQFVLESQLMQNDFEAEITVVTDNQKEIFDKIYNKEIDILFLDMDFKNSGKNGLDFARDLRDVNKEFYLIFLTAHQRYMHESFLVKVFDYIIKPTNTDVISDLVIRLKDEFKNSNALFLYLNKWITIRTDEILYIEKIGNKSQIVTKNLVETSNKTLDALLKELPNNFRKCHRSYIINENKILTLDKKEGYAYFSKKQRCPINSQFSIY